MNKVVHIQYSTESAGTAALRLQRALLNVNVGSAIVSLQVDSPVVDKVHYLDKFQRMMTKISIKIESFLVRKSNKQYGLFSYPVIGTKITDIPEITQADVIYIHWVLKGFLNQKNLEQLASLGKPVIIFMHDMWSITGGCHYSFSCENYKTGCHNCQMFPGKKYNGLASKGFKKKINLYKAYDNINIVTPSKWLYQCAKESLLTKDMPINYIPNLLDQTIYKSCDKKVAKRALNIDENEIIIAFGAVTIDSPYKGWSYLQKSLEIINKKNELKNITVLIFGSGYNKEIANAIPFKTKFMGYLYDEYAKALVYNAVDVFVAPSIAEAFGYVILESLHCGTPVVGFNTGGIPDMIRHKENGYLAEYLNAEDLANGVYFCLENKLKGFVPPELEHTLTVDKHVQLIKKLVNKTSNSYNHD